MIKRGRDRDLLSMGSFPKCLQQSRASKIYSGFLDGGRGQNSWIIFCFPGAEQEAASEAQAPLDSGHSTGSVCGHPRGSLTYNTTRPVARFIHLKGKRIQKMIFPLLDHSPGAQVWLRCQELCQGLELRTSLSPKRQGSKCLCHHSASKNAH